MEIWASLPDNENNAIKNYLWISNEAFALTSFIKKQGNPSELLQEDMSISQY